MNILNDRLDSVLQSGDMVATSETGKPLFYIAKLLHSLHVSHTLAIRLHVTRWSDSRNKEVEDRFKIKQIIQDFVAQVKIAFELRSQRGTHVNY